MPIRYFRVLPDDQSPQWMLDVPFNSAGEECNPWIFTRGNKVDDIGELSTPVEHQGPSMDFSFAHFNIPIVTPEIGDLIAQLGGDDAQLLPTRLPSGREMRILVATRLLDCLDRYRSSIKYYSAEHAARIGRPEKAGKPNMVLKLVIDATLTDGAKMLRIKDWEMPLIICEELKVELERQNVSGIGFLPVN